jgi:hypothetical protein
MFNNIDWLSGEMDGWADGRVNSLSLFRSVAEAWLPYSKNIKSKWAHNYQRNKLLSTLTEQPFTVRANSSVFARNQLRANGLLLRNVVRKQYIPNFDAVAKFNTLLYETVLC